MKPLSLTPHEVKLALKGGPFLLIRPVEPQPSFIANQGRCSILQLENKSPFGKPGDEFWVQEVWHSDVTQAQYEDAYGGSGVFYKATEIHPEIFYWKPASEMPQWASRLTLTHTGTEVKRVQDANCRECAELIGYRGDMPLINNVELRFEGQWQSQHPDYPWEENPWVFIGKFEVKG